MIIDTNPSKRVKRFMHGKNFIRMNAYTDPQAVAAAAKRKELTLEVRSNIIKSRLAPIVRKVALANARQLEEMNIEVEINPHFVTSFANKKVRRDSDEEVEISVETPETMLMNKKTSPEQSLANIQRISGLSEGTADEIQWQMLHADERKRMNQRTYRRKTEAEAFAETQEQRKLIEDRVKSKCKFSSNVDRIIDEIYHAEYTK